MTRVLVTGSNRDIGLEWCRHYAEAGWHVFATCCHPETADALHGLAREHSGLSVHRLDVTRPESVDALRAELQHETIDCSSTMPASISRNTRRPPPCATTNGSRSWK